jgi:MFS transporter, DHA1 family, inner membrane transport protein
MNKSERTLLFILAAINFTHIMDFMIMMPLSSYLIPKFKISPQQFSFIVSSYAFSAFVSSLSASFIVDRYDRKKVLLFAYIGFVVGTFACGLAPDYYLLLIARVVAGFFGGLIGAQVLSIVGDSFPFERRGAAMGVLMSAFAFASVAGVPVGLFLAATYSWHVPFIAIGSIGVLIIPFVIKFIPPMNKHIQLQTEKKSPFLVFKHIINEPNQQRGLLMMFTLVLAHFSIIPFIAPYMQFNVGFTKEQVALIYLVGGAVSLFSAPLIGKISDKYGKHRTFGALILLAIIPVYLLTNLTRIPIYYVLTITAFFFIFAGGRMIPAQAMVTSVVKPQQRGGFMNINSSFQQMATGLSAVIAGAIVEKAPNGELMNYQYVGYIGIGLSLVCLWISRKVVVTDLKD